MKDKFFKIKINYPPKVGGNKIKFLLSKPNI